MLEITVPAKEFYDEINEIFIQVKEQRLKLEHSLVSISKWESKWKKPFISNKQKTPEEITDYVRCMTLTQNVNPLTYMALSDENIIAINKYIDDDMTATWFSKNEQQRMVQREAITSEIIYYWMITLQIPFECQKWHINRLLTLINVCNIKNQPPKKMPKSESNALHRATNAARRKKYSSRR